jgi:hypothetical protein
VIITWVAGAILFGLVYFGVGMIPGSVGLVLTLIAAGVVGALAVLFLRVLAVDTTPQAALREAGMVGLATALGSGFATLALYPSYDAWKLLGIPLATLTAYLIGMGLNRQQGVVKCSLCRTPIADRASFTCPRCHQTVCSRPTCWKGQHARCRSCDEREVVLFPVREDWWQARLGARVPAGACHSCYKEAHEADLRECGQCRFPSCRRCWDYQNGRCPRCGWLVPDLPPAIQPFVGQRAGAPRRPAPPPRAAGQVGYRGHDDPRYRR